jgi:hypothetical protein
MVMLADWPSIFPKWCVNAVRVTNVNPLTNVNSQLAPVNTTLTFYSRNQRPSRIIIANRVTVVASQLNSSLPSVHILFIPSRGSIQIYSLPFVVSHHI